MKYEFDDICITDVEVLISADTINDCFEQKLMIHVDPNLDEDEFNCLFITKEDFAELEKHLGLVVYEKDSAL